MLQETKTVKDADKTNEKRRIGAPLNLTGVCGTFLTARRFDFCGERSLAPVENNQDRSGKGEEFNGVFCKTKCWFDDQKVDAYLSPPPRFPNLHSFAYHLFSYDFISSFGTVDKE